jgi:hypothetical protein
MCFVKKGCKLKVFESESDLQLESQVNFVSSAGFGYFVVMSCIEVWVCHNVIMTEVRHFVLTKWRSLQLKQSMNEGVYCRKDIRIIEHTQKTYNLPLDYQFRILHFATAWVELTEGLKMPFLILPEAPVRGQNWHSCYHWPPPLQSTFCI